MITDQVFLSKKQEKYLLQTLTFVILVIFLLFASLVYFRIDKENENEVWLSSASSQEIQFVENMKISLYKTKFGDLILTRDGEIFYVTGRPGVSEIEFISSVRFVDDGNIFLTMFSDLDVFETFDRVINQDNPDYDKYAGQFLRQK